MQADRDPRSTSVRSIREPGSSPRDPRLSPPARPQRPAPQPQARAVRSRPDANPLRLMFGLAGVATAAAFITAMLPSVTPAVVAADQVTDPVTAALDPVPAPSVQHVTRYVTLQPGQTAPPQSTVVVRPQPTPKVTVKVQVVTRTKQSGKP